MIRRRLARLCDATLSLLGTISSGSWAVRDTDPVSVRARHRELEERLAAANSEIEQLRARLSEPTRRPTTYTQFRAAEIAIGRQRRLWLARGGDRQS